MNIETTLDSIPIDIFLDIFSRLPAKSVGKCRCVSKLWASILVRQDFTDLFLTKSSTRPRLLLAIKRTNSEWFFYSSPHPQNPNEKFTVIAADSHPKFHRSEGNWSYASGLLYLSHVKISEKKGKGLVSVIYNPITGRYVILPKLRTDKEPTGFLGFDPIDKQFKVLLINGMVNNQSVHYILTLGTGKMRWRKIQYGPFADEHYEMPKGICINGVLYYLATRSDNRSDMIVCFDVRSEKFNFIDTKCFDIHHLINYKGKLGGFSCKYEYCFGWRTSELYMWVLEDVEKQEWSEYVYPFRENENRTANICPLLE